jgi:hypothetical protein
MIGIQDARECLCAAHSSPMNRAEFVFNSCRLEISVHSVRGCVRKLLQHTNYNGDSYEGRRIQGITFRSTKTVF